MRRQADTWLQQFQWTQEAWQVADALLHLPDSPLDVQYFCAQTLKKKAQRDFEELPQGAAPCASLILPSPHRLRLFLYLSACARLSRVVGPLFLIAWT